MSRCCPSNSSRHQQNLFDRTCSTYCQRPTADYTAEPAICAAASETETAAELVWTCRSNDGGGEWRVSTCRAALLTELITPGTAFTGAHYRVHLQLVTDGILFSTLAASTGKRNVTVWRGVRQSECPIFFLQILLPSPVVSLLHPGLPSRTIAWTVSSELLGFCFYFFLIFFVSVPCARFSWPSPQLLSGR